MITWSPKRLVWTEVTASSKEDCSDRSPRTGAVWSSKTPAVSWPLPWCPAPRTTSRTQSRKPVSLGDHRAQSFQAVELSPKRGILGQQLKVFFFERHLASIRLRFLFPNSFGLLQPGQVRFAVAIVGVAEDFGATRIGAEDLPVKAAFLGHDTFVQIDAVSRKRLVLVPFQVFRSGHRHAPGRSRRCFLPVPRAIRCPSPTTG